ncbi:hypothetical protein HYPDE_23303 [Hyphomicrobium denitrificans 1NES1]|uniref:Uncharacterized protein n=1 Tax=Hyphomicrobium denitrificans 1NES1 TaxID=670307 RepID=N0B2C6_9HYPH|nr:hypothetical protein HYPDE_23303 [Hyphomicrobium denitrificans 1NES1]
MRHAYGVEGAGAWVGSVIVELERFRPWPTLFRLNGDIAQNWFDFVRMRIEKDSRKCGRLFRGVYNDQPKLLVGAAECFGGEWRIYVNKLKLGLQAKGSIHVY